MIATKTKFKHDNNNVNKCLKEKKRLNTLQKLDTACYT